jgi:hypothetical protein
MNAGLVFESIGIFVDENRRFRGTALRGSKVSWRRGRQVPVSTRRNT